MSTSSISVAMNSAISGLTVNQTALTTTSNNIANANTAGYTRKIVNQEAVLIDGQGAGVQISGITRNVNEFLLRDVRVQTSLLAEITVQSDYFSAMQDMFGKPESNTSLGARLTAFANQLQALTVDPASNNNQITVVNGALTATRQLNEMAGHIQTMRDETDDSINSAVSGINVLLGNIAELNGHVLTITDASDAEGIQLFYTGTAAASGITLGYTVGLGSAMYYAVDNMLDPVNGSVENEITALTDQNIVTETRVTEMLARLERQRAALLDRFLAMESALTAMKNILDSLKETFSALTNAQKR